MELVVLGNKIDAFSKTTNTKSLINKIKGEIKNSEIEEIEGYTDVCYVTRGSISLDANSKVYLMNNLDMEARAKNGSTKEERWETEENEKIKWIPIGSEATNNVTSKSFPCLFDGNDYFIKGLYVK